MIKAKPGAGKPLQLEIDSRREEDEKAAQQKLQGAIEASRTELNKDADVAHETTQYHQPIPETTPLSKTRSAIVAEVYDL
ncbi:hypothetical protein KIN20_008078 [Parelaphostrongylus tenuis]|uniref:Uncharacterized protein n=1 Tax=Parelaphostrongylus tenuis TaxID=148309 RepID=A0AAD5MQL6_PARTN|nr:hypothetical protein KIN20_008078 [Parelaphostrongylus tenuis]